jgi:hypothetical protein
MKKSEFSRRSWFAKSRNQAAKVRFNKYQLLTTTDRLKMAAKYYFYLLLFKLAMLEFHLNMFFGKTTIGVFNVINRWKIRVNFNVNLAAENCRNSQR